MKSDDTYNQQPTEETTEELDLAIVELETLQQQSKRKLEAWEAYHIPFNRDDWTQLLAKCDMILDKIRKRKAQ